MVTAIFNFFFSYLCGLCAILYHFYHHFEKQETLKFNFFTFHKNQGFLLHRQLFELIFFFSILLCCTFKQLRMSYKQFFFLCEYFSRHNHSNCLKLEWLHLKWDKFIEKIIKWNLSKNFAHNFYNQTKLFSCNLKTDKKTVKTKIFSHIFYYFLIIARKKARLKCSKPTDFSLYIFLYVRSYTQILCKYFQCRQLVCFD